MLDEKFKFSDFAHFNINGKKVKGSQAEELLKKLDKENITVKEKLKVGDKVRLKGVQYIVRIEQVDYVMEGIGRVDYLGRIIDEKDNSLRLFNQSSIAEKIEDKTEKKIKEDKEEER